jgi:hypothetical protein
MAWLALQTPCRIVMRSRPPDRPRDEFGQLDPPVFTREFAAKGKEEILKRELMARLTSVHVENSGKLLGDIGPIGMHSTDESR